jgi:hypothetical protein
VRLGHLDIEDTQRLPYAFFKCIATHEVDQKLILSLHHCNTSNVFALPSISLTHERIMEYLA